MTFISASLSCIIAKTLKQPNAIELNTLFAELPYWKNRNNSFIVIVCLQSSSSLFSSFNSSLRPFPETLIQVRAVRCVSEILMFSLPDTFAFANRLTISATLHFTSFSSVVPNSLVLFTVLSLEMPDPFRLISTRDPRPVDVVYLPPFAYECSWSLQPSELHFSSPWNKHCIPH